MGSVCTFMPLACGFGMGVDHVGHTAERIVTALAMILMPLIGLAAAAHQVEQGSAASGIVYGLASLVAFIELARLSWRWHKDSRLHHVL